MRIFLGFIILFVGLLTNATSKQISAFEILNLPAENRKFAALESGADLIKELRVLANDQQNTMSVRWKALMLMTELNPKESIQDLLKAVHSPEWYMRNAGLVGLQSIYKEKALEVAQDLIKDKALVVRSAAVELLSQNLSPMNREILWQEFYMKYNFRAEQSLWIRTQILKALSTKPKDSESQTFIGLLKEKDSNIQYVSVLALEKLHGIKLGNEQSTVMQKISLWQDYSRKNAL